MLGPVVLLTIIAVGIFILRRRQERSKGAIPGQEQLEDEKKEKAQLHAESLKIQRHEMDGEGEPESRVELPAMEPVGSELDVQRTAGAQARGASPRFSDSVNVEGNAGQDPSSAAQHRIVRKPLGKTVS